jgi:peptide/nickel transport system substrate-binding protein
MVRLIALTLAIGTVAAATVAGAAGKQQDSPASPAARVGGTVTVGLQQEPDNLNPYLAVQTASRLVRETVLEGLLDSGPGNFWRPQLATVVPTVKNGGISKNGLRITYRLKKGLRWSDGHPLTSGDVRFTWQTIMNPQSRVNSQTGYDQIRSISTPNARTVVIRFKKLYAPALALFSEPDAVLPAHVLRGQAFGSAAFNRKPEGSGPFVVTEWRSGDSIVLGKNRRFRERGRPYLDRIVFTIIPSREVGTAQIRRGEIDVLWNLIESQIPQFQGQRDIKVVSAPSSNVEYLGLNLSQNADPAQRHPILGDRRVRLAIATAIDRKPVIRNLLYGRTTAATSPIGLGWAAPKGLSLPAYSPTRARALLQAAGWTGSGIREKGGRRLSLEISTPAGSQLREQVEQVLQQQLRNVGIELVIRNVPAAVLFGNWQENGKLKRGNFDIVMDTWGADFDPDAFLSTLFTSDQIPTAANNGEGWNFFRLQDAQLDRHVRLGRGTLSIPQRRMHYREAVKRILNGVVYIPLYNRAIMDAFRTSVIGGAPNAWDELTWNAKEWSRR